MSYIQHRADESVEDYLETILQLKKKLGQVRSIDIAREMNNLREKSYITVSEEGYISLTESGQKRAENVLERHTILSDWLISIGVSQDTALEDACKVEHDLSEESFEAIKKAVLGTKNGKEA